MGFVTQTTRPLGRDESLKMRRRPAYGRRHNIFAATVSSFFCFLILLTCMVVVLDNVRSLHNVGSIFRTSDAAGIEKIYLCGITPTPLDRLGRVRPPFTKVALGAEENVKWEKKTSTWRALDNLKRDGYKVFAVEQDKRSVPYYTVRAKGKVALVLGHEVRGLPESVLSRADKILEIPMAGIKESLNISVAFGIVAYSLIYSGRN